MWKYRLYIITLTALYMVSSAGFTLGGQQDPFTARVTKVIDGDSIEVRSGKKKYEVRLYGIDAPEYDQPFAASAKKYVKKSILDKKVSILPVDEDRYGRLVAIVKRGQSTINERLLERGLAWYYPKYCKKRVCSSWKKKSKSAKKKRKNIWSDADPIAPWRWKYNKQKGS